MDLHSQHSYLYTTFDFSSLEKEDFGEGIQVLFSLSWILSAHWWLVISRTFFLLKSDFDSPHIGPSRWLVNHCYNHRGSFSQPCSFCFCPPWWSFQGHGMQPVKTNFPDIGYPSTVNGWFSSLYHILPMVTYCGKPGEQFLRSHFFCTEGGCSF